jgi:polysaccharide biosynthesis/export protein
VRRHLLSTLGVAIALTIALAACQTTTPPPEETEHFPAAEAPVVRLQPGDMVQFHFAYWPELDTEQRVRPDGMVSLQLVGEVMAQGKTPGELRAELIQLYENKLRSPEINVVVASYDSHRIYVAGEVRTAGAVPMRPQMTVLEAVMMAGGFLKESAKISRVVVVRQKDGVQYARTVDLNLQLGETQSEPFVLQPNDIVFVPRTTIDRIDQWVNQYVNRIVPDSVIFNLTHPIGEQSIESNTTATSFQFQPLPVAP